MATAIIIAEIVKLSKLMIHLVYKWFILYLYSRVFQVPY